MRSYAFVLASMYRYSWLITFEIFQNFFFWIEGWVCGWGVSYPKFFWIFIYFFIFIRPHVSRADHQADNALLLNLFLEAYPLQDVTAQMCRRNRCLSSRTLLVVVTVPNVSVMYFSHFGFGFPLLLSPAIIPCIIVFSKPLCRVMWPKYLRF